jgi:hypothetical protein
MKIKPHQYQHIANGIKRVKLACRMAKLHLDQFNEPVNRKDIKVLFTDYGTFYSKISISDTDKDYLMNNITFGVPDSNGDVFVKGCFDKHFRKDGQIYKSFIPFRL